MLCMEDELIRHMFQITSSDRPDVSIGRCWAKYRRARGHSDVERSAPLWLPDQAIEVPLLVYDNTERGPFETWFGRVYLPEKMPDYYDRKPEFRREGELPPASAAEHTCLRLAGRPASLKPRLRRQLVAVGGFFPGRGEATVSTKPPADDVRPIWLTCLAMWRSVLAIAGIVPNSVLRTWYFTGQSAARFKAR
jgi:hypothetical protein